MFFSYLVPWNASFYGHQKSKQQSNVRHNLVSGVAEIYFFVQPYTPGLLKADDIKRILEGSE